MVWRFLPASIYSVLIYSNVVFFLDFSLINPLFLCYKFRHLIELILYFCLDQPLILHGFFQVATERKAPFPLSLPPSYLLTVAAVGNILADLTRRPIHTHTHPSKNTTQSLLCCCLQGAMPESCHLGAEVHAIQDSALYKFSPAVNAVIIL